MENKVDEMFANFENTVKEIMGMALAEDGRFGKIDPKLSILVTKAFNCYIDLARTTKELAKEFDERDKKINDKLDAITNAVADSKKEYQHMDELINEIWELRDELEDPDTSDKKKAELRKEINAKKVQLDILLGK